MKKTHNRYKPIFPLILAVSLIFLWSLNGCRKSGIAEFSDLAVVESYLIPGSKVSIKISQKVAYDESIEVTARDMDALEVRVGYGNTEYPLISMGNGVYTDTLGIIKIVPDSTYTLHLIYNGTEVTSSTIVPSKPSSVTQSVTSITMAQIDPENPSMTSSPDPVEITFANADASYYLTTVECMDTNLVSVYKDSIPDNDMLASQPVTGTEIDIHPMMIRYFGKNRIILYHINPEYSTFFMRQASTSQSYQEPPTNIVNGLGIFTGINADTLYLNVIQSK
jgi:hypothetical protein